MYLPSLSISRMASSSCRTDITLPALAESTAISDRSRKPDGAHDPR